MLLGLSNQVPRPSGKRTYAPSDARAAAEDATYATTRRRALDPDRLRPQITWGIESEQPTGTRKVGSPAHPVAQRPTGVRKLAPAESGHYVQRGKAPVRGADGLSPAERLSECATLELELGKKKKVSEAARTEVRTIERVAPPGLKGYKGCEHSTGYWQMDGVVVRTRLRPSRAQLEAAALAVSSATLGSGGGLASFASKRRAAEAAAEVASVVALSEYE